MTAFLIGTMVVFYGVLYSGIMQIRDRSAGGDGSAAPSTIEALWPSRSTKTTTKTTTLSKQRQRRKGTS